MIRDVDTALTELLEAAVPAVAVRLGVDGEEHGLRLLLHDVREEAGALAAIWEDRHDADGRVVSRRPPVRRFRLRYLVVAVGPDAATEHDWLGRVLVSLAAHPVVPAGTLTASSGLPVPLQVAPAGLPDPAPPVLAAVGARPALEVAVTAACVQPDITGLSPAPDTVDLGVAAAAASRARSVRGPGPVGRRIREGHGG